MTAIDWEQVSFSIITEAGTAKSDAMEALYAAKAKNYTEADNKMESASQAIGKAAHMHFEVIQKEANGEQLEFKVLFMHAEDQLLTTQTLILLVYEMIEMYKKFDK